MRKFHLVSLGCPKNRVDSEVALASLMGAGWSYVDDPSQADLLVVNTCGFIEDARAESIETILTMAHYKSQRPGTKLVAMGCLSQFVHEQIALELPEVDHILGTGSVDRIAELVASEQQVLVEGDKHLPNGASERVLSQSSAYAYLKVADGCSRSCSFCTIPLFKGPFAERPQEAIVEEARALVDKGVKEVVLVAQDLTQYGRSRRNGLLGLLRALERVGGLEWIRLMYLYPEGITEGLLEYVAADNKVVPYLDIPLQHVDDRILRLMKRGTTARKLHTLLSGIRSRYPSISLRTTFIVGFPGEDEQAFSNLTQAVESYKFDHMGVFTYSLEPDTPSATLPDRVSQGVATSRQKRLMLQQKRLAGLAQRALKGTVQRVLVDGTSEESALVHVGRLATQAPEVDGQVILELYEGGVGEFVDVKIVKATAYDLIARPLID